MKKLKPETMNNKVLLFILFVLTANGVWAQQAYPVTDTQPVLVNGFNIGYTIKSQEVKTVGDKGDFSRYSIKFYVTNTTNRAFIIPYRDGPNHPGNVSSLLAKFNIVNATGARLTSNVAMINAMPYNETNMVEEKDPHTKKIVKVQRMVQTGYCIQPGQTISADEIVIVPLNQLPDVQVLCMTGGPQQAPPPSYAANPVVAENMAPTVINAQGFLKLKSVFNNTYINIQTGVPVSSTIDQGWWSAQWQLTPIPGTNYFNIKNRWKGNFIDTDRGYITISLNPQSAGSMWAVEPTQDRDIFMIKNAKTGRYLSIASNNLVLSNNAAGNFSANWKLERP